MEVDVAVIGGGPAGLKAAIEIASRGGKVVVLDENEAFGGKLLAQLHKEPTENKWWNGKEVALQLMEEAVSHGVLLVSGVQVWGLEKGWSVYISDTLNRPLPSTIIHSKAILLATGATEKPLPIPGWTLPGVMTIGAAQVLLHVYNVKPGQKVLIVGLDVLSLSVAQSLLLAGVDVKGIVLSAHKELNEQQSNILAGLAKLSTIRHLAPNRMLRWCGFLLKFSPIQFLVAYFFPKKGLRIAGIPIVLKKALVSIEGNESVEYVKLASLDSFGNRIEGSETSIPIDAVCLSGGLTPLSELAAIAGCKFVRLDGLSGTVALHNSFLETTADHIFVAGNITGIESAKVAMAQGILAGKSICAKLSIGNVSNQELGSAIEHVKSTRVQSKFQFHSNIREAREQMEAHWNLEMTERRPT